GGIADGLRFGGKGSDSAEQMLTNLAAVSRDLTGVTAQIKDGKGTVGALLNDPSVYEDLKVLLGNVQRNQVLRALVRYSIQADEQNGVNVAPPQPQSAPQK